jgi:hypothetical protein
LFDWSTLKYLNTLNLKKSWLWCGISIHKKVLARVLENSSASLPLIYEHINNKKNKEENTIIASRAAI